MPITYDNINNWKAKASKFLVSITPENLKRTKTS